MRILYLSSSWPCEHGFGGQLRALHIGRALRQAGDVTLLVVSSDADDVDSQLRSSTEFQVLPPICPKMRANTGLGPKLKWALDTDFLNVHGCQAEAPDRQRLQSLLSQFDLIWLLNSRTPNILNIFRWEHSHLDIDDLPSTYLRAVARNAATPGARLKARVQQGLMKRREMRFRERFTTLSVCSEEDRAYLGKSEQLHVIPNGFARPAAEPRSNPSTDPPRLGFIGLYSYPPNFEGVVWFLQRVWPALRQALPGVRFRLAGRDTDGPLRPTEPDVDVLGWLDDPSEEIATWSGMVVPVLAGGGTRVKIADAFSRKCPVVSTAMGAYGYGAEDGHQLRLADHPEDFARACVELVRNREQAAAMAERAWAEFLQKWTWDAISPRVLAAAEDCIRRSRDAGKVHVP